MEQGAGVVMSMPLGGGHRRAAADRASAEGNAAQLEHMSVQRTVRAIADADLSSATLRLEAWKNTDLSAQSAASRSEEHTSELQSLMRISYAVFCLTKKNHIPYRTE